MYKEVLQDIKPLHEPNAGGSCRMIFAATEDISAMPSFEELMTFDDTYNGYHIKKEDIVLKEAVSWLNLNKLGNTIEVSITTEDDQHGKYYQTIIKFFLPKDEYQRRGRLLAALERRKFVIIAEDLNGKYRMIGFLERAADFNYSFSNKSGINTCECTFEWKSQEPPPYTDTI